MTDETQGASTQTPASDPAAATAKPAEVVVETKTAEVKPVETPAETKPVVPDKYEIKVPEGLQLDAAVLNEYTPIFKELGLTQEAAQKLVESNLAIQQAAQARQLQAWEGELKADKDFGGKNFEANVAEAQKAVGRFLTPQDKAFLDQTGLGNHPGLVKMFLRIGKAISEDAVPATTTPPASKGPKEIYNHPTSAQLS